MVGKKIRKKVWKGYLVVEVGGENGEKNIWETLGLGNHKEWCSALGLAKQSRSFTIPKPEGAGGGGGRGKDREGIAAWKAAHLW